MKKRSAFGWGELILGILLIVLGILTFVFPAGALTGAVFVYGILAVITGIADIVFYAKVEQHTGFGPVISLVTGILGVIAGVLLCLHPVIGRWILLILFPLWFMSHCISRLTHLPMIRMTAGEGYYYFTLVICILGLVLGLVMLLDPLLSLVSVSAIIGCYLILTGVDHLVLAVSNLGMRR